MKRTAKKLSILRTVFSITAALALSVAAHGIFTSPFACVAEDQTASTQSSEKPTTTQPVAKVSADETDAEEGCKLSYVHSIILICEPTVVYQLLGRKFSACSFAGITMQINQHSKQL